MAEAQGGPHWEIRLLGDLEIARDGELCREFPSRRSTGLLIALAVRAGRPRNRDDLATLLWPYAEPEFARNSLRQCLSQLRKAVGDPDGKLIEADRVAIGLSEQFAECDLALFRHHLAVAKRTEGPARLRALEAAVAQDRGELLPGENWEWLDAERSAHLEDRIKARSELAEALDQADRTDEALDVLRHAIAIDPLREETVSRALALCQAADNAAEGLRLFAEHERRLKVELGAAPALALRSLAAKLRSTSRAPDQAIVDMSLRSHLPSQAWPLVGRTNERSRLTELLGPDEGGARLVTLCGPGGIGKTHLALASAKSLEEGYRGRVWFVELETLTDPGQMVPAILQRMGASQKLPIEDSNALAIAVGDCPALIVLDNLEHLMPEAAETVKRALDAVPTLRFLTTSRQPLALQEERIVRLGPLGESDESEAVELFCARAEASGCPDLVEQYGETEVAELCSALEGIPLGIVLAASRARTMSPKEIRENLDRSEPESGGRQSSVSACVRWSLERLGPLADVLAETCVFQGGWTREAFEGIAPGSGTLADLDELCDRSLVTVSPTPLGTRYSMYDLVRRTAGAGSRLPGTERTHAEYFKVFVEGLADKFDGQDGGRALSLIGAEEANIDRALDWLLANDLEAAHSTAYKLAPFWLLRGRCLQGIGHMVPIIGALEAAGHSLLGASLRHRLAVLQRHYGQYQDAEANLNISIAAFRSAGESTRIAEGLNSLGNFLYETRADAPASVVAFKEALAIFENEENSRGTAMVSSNLSRSLISLNEFDEAESLLEKAIAINRVSDNRVWISNNLCEFAEIRRIKGEWDAAESCLREALDLQSSIQTDGRASTCLTLVDLEFGREDIERAKYWLQEAFNVTKENGNLSNLAKTLRRLSDFCFRKGFRTESARLLGVEHELRARVGLPVHLLDAAQFERVQSEIRQSLGAAYETEFQIGRTKPLAQALTWAEGLLVSVPVSSSRAFR